MQGVFPIKALLNVSTIQMVTAEANMKVETHHAGENLQPKKEVPSGESQAFKAILHNDHIFRNLLFGEHFSKPAKF
jgi:hypothetical protein